MWSSSIILIELMLLSWFMEPCCWVLARSVHLVLGSMDTLVPVPIRFGSDILVDEVAAAPQLRPKKHDSITISHQAIAGIFLGTFLLSALVIVAVYVCKTRKYIHARRANSLARARSCEVQAELELESHNGSSSSPEDSHMAPPGLPLHATSNSKGSVG